MDLRVLLLALTMLWKMTSSLRCYKCEAQIVTYTEKLCDHFDYSDKYVVECPLSTMCYKKVTTSPLEKGSQFYERGCARQSFQGDQDRTTRGWRLVNRTYEVYKEGCGESPINSDRITTTTFCYCRGDLCNGTAVLDTGRLILVLMIGLLYIVIRH